jgi:hypothetical protein
VQTEFVGDFGGVHCVREILFVGEDEEEGVLELRLVEHPLEFFTCFGDTFTVIGIDDEDDSLGVLEVWR